MPACRFVPAIAVVPAIAFCMALIPPAGLQGQESGMDSDQEAIRHTIVGYVKAINDRDAAAAASFWSAEGVWIDPEGHELTGPEEIREHLNEAFEAGSMPQIVLEDVHVRFVDDDVATEEGHVILTRPGMPPENSTYICIHHRTPEGWKLYSVRETVMPRPMSNYDQLKQLEWMVGDWVDAEGEMKIETNCDWVTNRNFLLRSFRAINGETVEMEGTQIIGWDADTGQIRSWVFDSDGGFGQGTWSRDGNTWTVQSGFQDALGAKGTSTNRFTYIDADTFTYGSTDRFFDGESLPDLDSITIKRASAPEGQDDP